MKERWLIFCRTVGANGLTRALFEILEAMYAHPRRLYHNLEHIRACFQLLDEVGGAEEPVSLELALWLHDCLYEPGRPDNETLSAQVAGVFGRELRLGPGTVQRTQELILATRHSRETNGLIGDVALIADIDLGILGAADEVYDRYAAAIRVEFGHLPDEVYRKCREGFLRSLLARKAIYRTDRIFVRLEAKARANIEREIMGLEMR